MDTDESGNPSSNAVRISLRHFIIYGTKLWKGIHEGNAVVQTASLNNEGDQKYTWSKLMYGFCLLCKLRFLLCFQIGSEFVSWVVIVEIWCHQHVNSANDVVDMH